MSRTISDSDVDVPGEGDEEPEEPASEDRRRRGPRALRWWREVLYAAVFYGIYSVIRNTQGSAAVSASHALGNALEIIRVERFLGLYHERAVQEAFLDQHLFIELWNLFYGTFHFVVTVFALVLLFRKFPQRYRRWRNTLAITTGLALIGFATYPLMPPRLMPPSYGFVDTLKTYGSLWSFDSGAVHKISNQYAAMPSLHFAWALWSTLVLVPALRAWWAKALAAVYPLLTLFAIVVTANHFVLDAAGGAALLGVGAVAGFALAARTERAAAQSAPAAA
ncbi:MAG: phosphatase PAP2 family protein [Acidimicrobiales bacterium]